VTCVEQSVQRCVCRCGCEGPCGSKRAQGRTQGLRRVPSCLARPSASIVVQTDVRPSYTSASNRAVGVREGQRETRLCCAATYTEGESSHGILETAPRTLAGVQHRRRRGWAIGPDKATPARQQRRTSHSTGVSITDDTKAEELTEFTRRTMWQRRALHLAGQRTCAGPAEPGRTTSGGWQ
jgi:hypothetical protein